MELNTKCKELYGVHTTTGQPALGILSERRPPKGFKPAYSTNTQASIPKAS